MSLVPLPCELSGMPWVEVIEGRGGPVLLSVPHSGREYPADLIARSRVGRASLEQLEDPLVDRLVAGVIDRGAGAVIARAPRAMIDVNRSPHELHPAAIKGRRGEPPTPRARAGLGVIPTRLAGIGDLWRCPIDEDEFERRLALVHRFYHAALSERLERLAQGRRDILLLDCHSMPERSPGKPAIIFGDRNGTSAAAWLVEAAEAIARKHGFTVARNLPFAGGHIVERHGRPHLGVHALQVEVDRSTYCQRDMRTPGPGFDRVALLFEALAAELGAALSHGIVEPAG